MRCVMRGHPHILAAQPLSSGYVWGLPMQARYSANRPRYIPVLGFALADLVSDLKAPQPKSDIEDGHPVVTRQDTSIFEGQIDTPKNCMLAFGG